jgi:hypothetical protein
MENAEHRLLAPLREVEPAGEPGYDVAAAMVGGRRRIVRRRAALGAGAAAVVALAVVGGTLGSSALRSPRPEPTTRAVPAASHGSSGTPAAAPRQFDPATLRFTVGWYPSKLDQTAMETTRYSQQASYRHTDEQDYASSMAVRVNLFAAGAGWSDLPTAEDGRGQQTGAPAGDPGPRVGGRDTTWLAGAPQGTAELVWQWAPGAYAVAYASTGDGRSARVTVTHVANSLHIGQSAVRIPFQAPRPPTGQPLRQTVVFHEPDGSYGATLSYSDRPGMLVGKTTHKFDVALTWNAHGARDHKDPAPTTTLDGLPANLTSTDAWVYDTAGNTRAVHSWLRAGVVDPTALVRRIKPVAGQQDESHWVPLPR